MSGSIAGLRGRKLSLFGKGEGGGSGKGSRGNKEVIWQCPIILRQETQTESHTPDYVPM